MINITDDKMNQMLKAAGLRQTDARIGVLSALAESEEALTQEQIAEKLVDIAPNKTTIYRILESLVRKGIVHKAFTRDRSVYFELGDNCSEKQCHPHFTCTTCERTVCLTDVEVPLAGIGEKGYEIHHQKVEIQGLCPTCSRSATG
jgi:Fur family ferric uptake transcriptional regulator